MSGLAQVNKGAVVLIMALLIGAAGYLFYTTKLQPAEAEKVAVELQLSTAQQTVTDAEARLAKAEEDLNAASNEAKKPDTAVGDTAIGRTAVPPTRSLDNSVLVLTRFAEKAGLNYMWEAELADNSSGGTEAALPSGIVPIDVTIEAGGTYPEMVHFLENVDDTVISDGKNVHIRGRLFNIVALEMKTPASDGEETGFASVSPQTFGSDGEVEGPSVELDPNDIFYEITIRFYTTTQDAATSASLGASGTGDPAADPLAQGTDPNAVDPNAVDPNAAGAVPADPSATPSTAPSSSVNPSGGV